MSVSELFPDDPVTLAAPVAETLALRSYGLEVTKVEQYELASLDDIAGTLGFIGMKYFVESRRSLSIPVSFERDEPVSYQDFMGLSFEGDFVCYSKVAIGRIIGARSVRALCLSFDKVTLLPYFDNLPEDHLLHVPVMAVESIDRQAA